MTLDKIDTDFSHHPDRLQASQIRIVQLQSDQWTILRDLKLRSLDQESIAFADVEEERTKYLQRSEEEWRAILSGKMSGGREGETVMVFVADGDQYVGMVSAIIPTHQPPEATKATIQHMFVDNKGYRGLGIGKQLLTTLLEKLRNRGDIRKAELQVLVTQNPARKLYESIGFREVRIVEKAAKRGHEEYDEVEMELDF